MTYIIIWLICGFICATIAGSKGRSGFGWFILGALFGPLGILMVAFMPTDIPAVEKSAVSSGASRKCPYCAELVKAEAIRCKHCSAELEPIEQPAIVETKKPTDPFDTSQFTNRCKRCGSSYPYKDKKCPDCGASRG